MVMGDSSMKNARHRAGGERGFLHSASLPEGPSLDHAYLYGNVLERGKFYAEECSPLVTASVWNLGNRDQDARASAVEKLST